jgi:hypothetical protein
VRRKLKSEKVREKVGDGTYVTLHAAVLLTMQIPVNVNNRGRKEYKLRRKI